MQSLKSLRDEDLLRQLSQLVERSRGVEADVVAHIGEVERRRLYAHEACSSMFEYCRRVLGLRENEAYLRITVARAARENPSCWTCSATAGCTSAESPGWRRT